jgi:two-component system sensor histidine kinase KdpD
LFSKKLAGVGSLDDVLWASAYQTALMLKVRVMLLLPEEGDLAVRGAYPPEDILDEADLAAAKWAWQNNRPAGRGSDTLPGAKRLFLPMRTGRGAIGVVGIDSDKPGPLLSPDDRRLLDALIDQSALAIERVFLVEDMDRVKRNAETDRLRSALLTSISHDLKTPLAAVLGSASTLRDLSGKLDDAAKAELLATIIDESERLNRFIANLLDMTKLESGAIAPNVAPYDLREIVDTALRRASKILSRHRIELKLAVGLPMVEIDAVLFEQALFNILDNAAKYAPSGTAIRIESERDGPDVVLRVMDEGEGIPPADLEHIFDKFYRARKGDQVRPGTGLGLAIARGFIEAMRGSIFAANRHDRTGAAFIIKFPVKADVRPLETAA